MMMGVLTLVAGMLISPSLVAWMSPTIAGLVLAVLLSWASGQKSIGLALKRVGLLRDARGGAGSADRRPRQRA